MTKNSNDVLLVTGGNGALGSALVALDRPRTQRRMYPVLERARMSAREASVWIAVLERIRRAFANRDQPAEADSGE